MKILVTGAAGFIGFHTCRRLIGSGNQVTGLDNLNDYYDVSLKQARLEQLLPDSGFRFIKADISDRSAMKQLFDSDRFDTVIHLAAQAGVRYSVVNPDAYVDSNLCGFANILEGCRQQRVSHLVFASSSSVYGANGVVPFSVRQNVDHPLSLYAATKKANELMAHSYATAFGIPVTGLRFFTVYGPWGRPDMAYFSFADAIMSGRPIELYNNGNMKRDFTYIDDITEGILRISDKPARSCPEWNSMETTPDSSFAPYRIYNIGNNQPVDLIRMVKTVEKYLGRSAIIKFMPAKPGEVETTWADISELEDDTGFRPVTSFEEGMAGFVRWYLDYYGESQ